MVKGGGTFLVEWSDNKAGTKHECSWEPEENLTHAGAAVGAPNGAHRATYGPR